MTTVWYKVSYLLGVEGKVTPASLAREMGVTRQAAGKHLRRMAQRGQLVRVGAARTVRYLAPPRGADDRYLPTRFWEGITRTQPQVHRIHLARSGVALRWRKQVKPLLAHLDWQHRFMFLDFAGVEDASEPFLDELLRVAPQSSCALFMPINVCPELQKKIARVRLMTEREGSDDTPDECCS
ncbi:MAG: hypothetical protein IRZ16_03080 [Myxococcaceae bacterium]|nr:hypothetical protein [Myxococcaceae bacterium]